MAEITLSAASRANLLSLKQTADLIGKTQNRLATGLKVSSAVDDAVKFFQAKGLTDRATDFRVAKDSIDQAVQAVNAGIRGLESASDIVDQLEGLARKAQSTTDTATRSAYATQFSALSTQLDNLISDASYGGKNLVNGGSVTLTVNFNESNATELTISATANNASGLGISAAVSAWQTDSAIADAISDVTAAGATLRTNTESLGSNAALLEIRSEFTDNYTNVLQAGADELTLADTNEEGANLTALQTRQQLGVISLSIASQSEQSILRLF